MRGRKPKSTAAKLLDGNPGHRAINTLEPHPEPLDPAIEELPPEELAENPIARKEWIRLAPMLRRCRQITEADRSALIALCVEWARYIEATAHVRHTGLIIKAPSGYPIPNPYLPIATKALAGCNKLWPELGLTPSSRSRVVMSEGSGGIAGDAFTEFDTPIPLNSGKH